ncbi:hypothetical protein H6G89_18455 [Oscillatoria sp. FACHB-1407]|uniref:DUF6010 family protein n=1 Tax=Oscillatoria sp. FACHB-1407 TaxID=2692847 RepID=UPI001683EBB7|nr:DUF6010 family protein [Oscillatoria sp. FACHB-1407]MBD2463025.1 hypothetical protein [Oscillatoria sp. FACHB-1407]
MIDFATASYLWIAIVKAVLVALISIVSASCMKEPGRQKLMAIVLGLAAGVYLDGGFVFWEFPFAIAVVVCAYKGLHWYPAIGIGWLLHTGWDILHHAAHKPLIGFLPTSSLECAITDAILAAWLFASAPDVREWLWKRTSEIVE